MTLITYKPARTIFNEIDSLFDNFWNIDQLTDCSQNFQPSFNISQNKTSYFIDTDLPGIDKKDINISINDDMITISGERKINQKHDDKYERYNNSNYGTFEKSFHIPDDANIDKIDAKMDNGVLTISIKKAEKVSADIRKISIK